VKKTKYIIGIDEAGRGPLSGPVSVGVALVPSGFDWSLLKGVRDSKKLSPKNRFAIFGQVIKLKKIDVLDYAVVMVSAKLIDKNGIVPAIKKALSQSLTKVMERNPDITTNNIIVKLDGGLKAPEEFLNQETIIKGDDKELVIGLASIMAKVTRDKYMEKISRKAEFAKYDFVTHKGYGTKSHREAIAKYGLSKEHRQTFCRNIKISPQ
jgi:ribonuclease HII